MSSAEPEGLHANAGGTKPGPCSLSVEELNTLRVEQLRACLRIVVSTAVISDSSL